MKEKIFAVYDQKARIFLPVFQARTAGAAERSFQDAVNSQNHQFGDHPEDFVLKELGELELDTGVINPCVPRDVVRADQVKHGKEDYGQQAFDPRESVLNGAERQDPPS